MVYVSQSKMPLTVSTSTENEKDCPVCCRRLQDETGTSSICRECKIRFLLRENYPVERSPINNELEPETEAGAVGGEVRNHATHPVNVREQLLEEQTAEQGLGGHINGVSDYPNGLMEVSAALMSQYEVQELTQQSVGRRSYTPEMRQGRGGVIVAGCRQDAERRTQQLLYSRHLNGVHPRGGFRSAGDDQPLARDMYRGSNLEIGGKRYPIQERNIAGPVEHNCTCTVSQQYPINRSSPPEPPLTEGRVCNGTYIWRILDFPKLLQDAMEREITSFESPPIYTQLYGYKFCMGVYPNGMNDGIGRSVALYVRLMPGEFDDILDWPFTGRITLSILDVDTRDAAFRNHISGTFLAKPNLAPFQKPRAADVVNLYGYQNFAPIQLVCSPQYMKDNSTVMVKIEIRR